METTAVTFESLVRRLRALSPSVGPVRLVAVDGPSGAGKSTFARRLAQAADDAPVVTSDQFPVPWDGDPLVWWPLFAAEVLAPLDLGLPGGFRPYDWHRNEYGARIEIPVSPILIVEGVGAARPESPAAYRIWVDAPQDVRGNRVIARDGLDLAEIWRDWDARTSAHFTTARTAYRADLHIAGAAEIDYDQDREFIAEDLPGAR
ncbi:uridine kinase [Nocardia sp. NPDC052566]|uniref:uridine kinase n=1 Tax=Nocardia sp. NPDC052566 TaxID=3364330 RepID=UPI0037CA0DBC